MSKRQVITILGVWVMAFLFLGIPTSWLKIVALLTGLVIVSIALSLRPEQSNKE